MTTYFISLSEGLAQGRAGPSGLNAMLGPLCGGCGWRGLQTQSALYPVGVTVFPCLTARARAGLWALDATHIPSPQSLSLPHFFPFFFGSLFQSINIEWSIRHVPSSVLALGHPGRSGFTVLKQMLGS